MRRLAIGFGAILLLIAAGLAFAWWARAEITRRAVDWQLAQLGIPPEGQGGAALEAGRLVLSDLQFGGSTDDPEAADLRIGHLEAHFGLSTLFTGRADAVTLDRVSARATLDPEAGWSLGSLDPLLAPDEAPAPSESVPEPEAAPGAFLPAGRVRLEQAQLSLEMPTGRLVVEGQAELREPRARTLDIEADVLATHPFVTTRLALEGSGGPRDWRASAELWPETLPASLIPDAGLRVTIEAEGAGETLDVALRSEGGLSAPDIDLAVGSLAATLQGGLASWEATLRADPVTDRAVPARFAPVSARLAAIGGAPESPVAVDARFALADGDVVLRADGEAALDASAADLRWALEPVHWAPDALQPADVLPLVAPFVTSAEGSVEAKGTLKLVDGAPLVVADCWLRDLTVVTPAARFQGMNGRIRVSGPEPLTTPPDQLVSIALVEVGLPLTDGLLRFQLLPSGAIALAEATWNWAGGTLVVEDAVLDPSEVGNALRLQVATLDLSQMLALVNLEGLSGTGNVNGVLPLVQDGDAIRVVAGRLAATGPGHLAYAPDAMVGAIAERQSQFDLVLSALDDFSYETLTVDLSGDTRGVMTLLIHLRGRNPNFQGGRLVEFNVNLEAQLSDLVRAGLAAYRVPEVIEERIRARQRQERP